MLESLAGDPRIGQMQIDERDEPAQVNEPRRPDLRIVQVQFRQLRETLQMDEPRVGDPRRPKLQRIELPQGSQLTDPRTAPPPTPTSDGSPEAGVHPNSAGHLRWPPGLPPSAGIPRASLESWAMRRPKSTACAPTGSYPEPPACLLRDT